MDLDKLFKSRQMPEECPFCLANGVETREFVLRFWEEHYYDAEKGKIISSIRDDGVQVFCVKCEEEIRPEDLSGGVE